MRLARKLMLLAITALAALAMSATGASAEDFVEVSDSTTGEHCSLVVQCETNIHSEEPTVIRAHLLSGPEVTSSICTENAHVIINTEDGEGYFEGQTLTGGGCPNKPCGATDQDNGDGDPWPFHMHETEGENPTHEFGMDIDLCLEPNGGGGAQRHCIVEAGFNEEPMMHQYEFEAEGPDGDGIPCGPGSTAPPAGVRVLEVDCHWITEDENIEVNHVE